MSNQISWQVVLAVKAGRRRELLTLTRGLDEFGAKYLKSLGNLAYSP